MKKLILVALLLLPALSTAEGELTEPQLKQLAEAFLEAKNARQQPDTTVEDIDHFIALLADEFVDEHVKFGVVVSDKTELRNGMLAKMKDEVFYSDIKIDQMMFGRNVVFVKYTETAKVKPSHIDKVVEYSSANILSLEFTGDGLIKHIRRHHG